MMQMYESNGFVWIKPNEYFSRENLIVEIFTVLGQRIKQKCIVGTSSISIETLPSSMYIVKVTGDEGRVFVSEKIIKK